MIKIKAPIEMKSAKAVSSSSDAFSQRIMGNYQLMSAQIKREDLLHVVTSPPEIYIDGGGSTSILQDTRIQNNRETKLEVINNLLNRISVTEEVNLTYQDRVYITDVLHRLGITDSNQFMKQLSFLKQETQNVRKLTDLYWNNLEELNRTLEEYQSSSASHVLIQESYSSQERLHLHEDILNRLQTGAIYQILNNFYSQPAQNVSQVRGQELTFSEQQRMVSHILLNRLQTQAVGRQVPFVYRHENFYEENRLEDTQVTQESVNSQITSAILLHLADSLYQNLTEKDLRSSQVWVHVENALYQTAENTLQRLSYSMAGQNKPEAARPETAAQEIRIQEQEVETLRELLSFRRESEQTLLENRTVVSEDAYVPREEREPVQLSYVEMRSGEEQEAFKDTGSEMTRNQQTTEKPASDRKLKTGGESVSPPFVPQKKATDTVQEKKLPEEKPVSTPSGPSEKEIVTGGERETERPSARETGTFLSPEKKEEALRDEAAAQGKPAAGGQGRTEIFEHLLNQYLSIVYHADESTDVSIEPMELSLRREQESPEQAFFSDEQSRMETGEESFSENRTVMEGQSQMPAIPFEGETGQETLITHRSTESGAVLLPGAEKIREYVREENAIRERGERGVQERPMLLVFPESEASEDTNLTGGHSDSSGQEAAPSASDRAGEALEKMEAFPGSGQGEETETRLRPEAKTFPVPEAQVEREYSPLSQAGQEERKLTAESAMLELTYRAEEKQEEEIPAASGKSDETIKPQEALIDHKVQEALEKGQDRKEKAEKRRPESVPQISDGKQLQSIPEGPPGQEFHYINEILSQRNSPMSSHEELSFSSQEGEKLTLIYQQGEEIRLQESESASPESEKPEQPPVTEKTAAGQTAGQIIQQTSQRILRQMEDVKQAEAVKSPSSRENSGKTDFITVDQTIPLPGRESEPGQENDLIRQGDIFQSVSMGDIYRTSSRTEEANIYYSGQNPPEDESRTPGSAGEDPLMEELLEINRRNVENYQRYQQLVAARQQEENQRKKSVRPASMKMREESLKALENPQLVKEEHYKKETQDERARSAVEQAMEEMIPEQTRAIYEKVFQMQQERQSSPDQGAAQQNVSLQELMLDIRQTERENEVRTQELTESRRELHDTTEKVMEQRREYESLSPSADSRTRAERQNLSLVHKSLENRVDEEELTELLEQNRTLRRDVNVTNRVEETRREENVTHHQQTVNTRYEEKEDIERLIQRGVQRQMGVLSDQIYTKLERRLENEKKRRGY